MIFDNIFVRADEEKILKALSALDNLYQDDYNREAKCVKLFNAMGAGTWELIAFNPDNKIAFGLCDLGMGFPELGYVSVTELFESVPMLEMDKFYDQTWQDILERQGLGM